MKRIYSIILLISILTLTVIASASTFKIASAQGYPGPYYAVENFADNSSKVTMGPSAAIGGIFSVIIKLNNVTKSNVPAGIAGIEVHLTWNNALIEPVNFTDDLGKPGGVLIGPTVLETLSGFYDAAGNVIATAPFTNVTHFELAGASTSGGWWGDGGEVAVIAFKVDLQPQPYGTCPLAIDGADLSDAAAGEVAYSLVNATYTITTTSTTSESVSFQGVSYTVSIASDSMITAPANLGFQNITNDGASLTFNVTSADGFCNVTIPNNFMWSNPNDNWTITVDNAEPQSKMVTYGSSNTYVWFNWSTAGNHVILLQSTNVVPEFAATSLMLFLMATTLIVTAAATGLRKRKLNR